MSARKKCPNGYARDYLLNGVRSDAQALQWGVPDEWVAYESRAADAIYRLHQARLHEEEAALIETLRAGRGSYETYRGIRVRMLALGYGLDHLLMCEALLDLRYTPAQRMGAER